VTADFAGRTGAALVVGGSGGLGAAIAAMLAERGADVATTYRTRAPASGSAYRLDLGDPNAAAGVVEQVVADHGGLHTLVYAAGPHVPMTHLSRVAPADMAGQLAADAAGFFSVTHASLPALREARGSIVAVTTAATARFPIRDGLSSAPKAAVEAMVRGSGCGSTRSARACSPTGWPSG
jgi:NAD(P)-dependent dehydrogenase (short-subunit alcohol dehydrogenase family)